MADELRAILALMEEAQKARQKALEAVQAAAAAKLAAQADLDAALKIHGNALSQGPPAPPVLDAAAAAEFAAALQGAQGSAGDALSQSPASPEPGGSASPPSHSPPVTREWPYPPPALSLTVELALLEDRDVVIAPLTMPTGGSLPVRFSVTATAPSGGPCIDDAYINECCAGDYITLCRADDSDHVDQFGIEFTDGRAAGEVLLQLPRLPGRYDVRYVTPVSGGRVLARSDPIEVSPFSDWAAAAAAASTSPRVASPLRPAAPPASPAPVIASPVKQASAPVSPENPELSAVRAAAARAAADAGAAASAFAASHLPPKPAAPRPKPAGPKPISHKAGAAAAKRIAAAATDVAPVPQETAEPGQTPSAAAGVVAGSANLPGSPCIYVPEARPAPASLAAPSAVSQQLSPAGAAVTPAREQQRQAPYGSPAANASPRFAATPQPWRVAMRAPDVEVGSPSPQTSSPAYGASQGPPPAPVAAFLLEKQVKISVYQLSIPLPPHCQPDPAVWPAHARAAYLASGGGAGGGASVMHLPAAWRPGLSVTANDADARGCVVEVVFELPDTTPAELQRVTPHLTPQERTFLATRLPRRAHALRLCLTDRVDPSTASVQLFPDHMSVRLPLLLPGAAVPDRDARVGRSGAEEVRALRAAGQRLACNACRGTLVLPREGCGGGEAPPGALRAHLLPSEHWTEWTDLWVCHGEEADRFAAAGDFGAVRGAVLVGEHFLQLHPRDVDPAAVVLRVGAAALLRRRRRLQPEGEAGAEGSNPAGDDDASVAAAVECARCLAPLGSCSVPAACVVLAAHAAGNSRGGAVRLALPAAEAASGGDGGTGEEAAATARLEWPDRLPLGAGPVLRLFKHRVNVPAAPAAPGAVDDRGGVPRLCVPSAFAGHSAGSALAARLLAAALAHQQFRFAVVVAGGDDGGDSIVPEESGGPPPSSSSSLPSGLSLAVTLVNWNTSLRCSGSSGGAWRDLADDTPVLKLRVLDAAAARAASDARLSEWAAEGGFARVPLSAPDAAAVREMLTASSALVPPSVRVLGGMDVAYLPLPC